MAGDPHINRINEVVFVGKWLGKSVVFIDGLPVDKMENLKLVSEHEVILNLLVELIWNFYRSL